MAGGREWGLFSLEVALAGGTRERDARTHRGISAALTRVHATSDGGRNPRVIQSRGGDEGGGGCHGLVGRAPRLADGTVRERYGGRAAVPFALANLRVRGTEALTGNVTKTLARTVSRGVRVVRHERFSTAARDVSRGAEHLGLKEGRRRLGGEHRSGAVRVRCLVPGLGNDVRDGDQDSFSSLESLRAAKRTARRGRRSSQLVAWSTRHQNMHDELANKRRESECFMQMLSAPVS